MGKALSLRPCTTIRELDETRTDLILVTDSQDVRETKRDLGRAAREFGGFLVKVEGGEITEAWGFMGNVPFLHKLACKVKP